ncbi:hypothetical protein, partial [Anaplasma bovis]|uniref:hypothetical protein n=1 Tax=Anaplasma bovis TaxID=186733 RepID=UPI002FF3341D
MRSIVQNVASAVSGVAHVDLHVYNEVVVRAVLRSIYRGAAPKYTVKTKKKFGNTLYSHEVDTPGLFTSIPVMREHYAAAMLKKRMYDSTGNNVLLDSVCRYIVSICAFIPEYVDDMIRSIDAITRGCEFLDIVEHIASRMQELFQGRMATSPSLWINWGKLHAIYYDRLYEKAYNTMSDDSIAMVAYAIFSGRACSELTKLRDELQGIFSESSVIATESAPDILMKLALLANFSVGLSKDFRVHVSRAVMNLRGKSPSVSMLIRPRSILRSLSAALPHNLQDAVNDTIRNTCLVNAEMLLLSSMLFGNTIAISADKIGGLVLDSGDWIYCFSTKFSFPLLREASHNDFTGDFLTSKIAQNLIDLLIESHHLRERCSFHVSYSKLAEEVRDLDCRMETEELAEVMLQNICEALFEVEPSGVEIYGKLRMLVSLFGDRIKFLRAFVDSPDYKHLADFLVQSNAVDSYADFANYLIKKRRLAKEVADGLVMEQKRRQYKFVSAVGEVASVIVVIAGMSVVLSSFYCMYTKDHSGASFALLSQMFSPKYIESHVHVLLIAGIVVTILGFLLLTVSWISSTRLYKSKIGAGGELNVSGTVGGGKEIKCKFDKKEYLLSIPYTSVDLTSVGFVPGRNTSRRLGASVTELELGWKSAAPLGRPLGYRDAGGSGVRYIQPKVGYPEDDIDLSSRRAIARSHNEGLRDIGGVPAIT